MAEWSNARVSPAGGGSAFGGKAVDMPCIYILLSQTNGKHYVGSSREDIADTRVRGHNAGKARSTRSGRPWKLIHQEQIATYTEARKREGFLKSGQGRKWIKENFAD